MLWPKVTKISLLILIYLRNIHYVQRVRVNVSGLQYSKGAPFLLPSTPSSGLSIKQVRTTIGWPHGVSELLTSSVSPLVTTGWRQGYLHIILRDPVNKTGTCHHMLTPWGPGIVGASSVSPLVTTGRRQVYLHIILNSCHGKWGKGSPENPQYWSQSLFKVYRWSSNRKEKNRMHLVSILKI